MAVFPETEKDVVDAIDGMTLILARKYRLNLVV
jgi:hypothetical protein